VSSIEPDVPPALTNHSAQFGDKMASASGSRHSARIAKITKPSAASSKPRSKSYDRPSRRAGKRRASPSPLESPVEIPEKVENAPSQLIYLRINRRLLNQLSEATEIEADPEPIPPAPDTTGNLNIIIAELPDLQPYTAGNIDWLPKVARLILEPLGTSSLYTFTSGSVEYWLDKDFDGSQWREVQAGEQLQATIYEFRPNNNIFVTPTRICARHARSVTTIESADQATKFREALLSRDTACCYKIASSHISRLLHRLPLTSETTWH